METEKHKHLFTPGKPETDGKYLALSSLGGIEYIHYTALIGWNTHEFVVITHWLDLSKLTTKEKAIEAVNDTIDCLVGYVVEWHDSTYEQKEKDLQEIKSSL